MLNIKYNKYAILDFFEVFNLISLSKQYYLKYHTKSEKELN